MGKRTPKTIGSEWLYHSMNAFNGSGYADKTSPDAFIESYKYYKAWKNEPQAIQTLNLYRTEAAFYAERLVDARDAGHTPSHSNIERFESFKRKAGLLV